MRRGTAEGNLILQYSACSHVSHSFAHETGSLTDCCNSLFALTISTLLLSSLDRYGYDYYSSPAGLRHNVFHIRCWSFVLIRAFLY
jgi:hypothetical protein